MTTPNGVLYKRDEEERFIQLKTVGDSRSPFRRDYARLLHSPAFRRLQGKTQLFPVIESDYFRNRLTHSLEVAQVAKSIAAHLNATCQPFKDSENLRIDADLVETVALAHDLGHPPFGHNGEEALDECMREAGGFEGNAQTLRILARLEKRETKEDASGNRLLISGNDDRRVGLNLTYRTLAGILKYDMEIPKKSKDRPESKRTGPMKGYYTTEAKLVETIHNKVDFDKKRPTRFGSFKTIECSIMDIADDIAYSTYDLDDTFKAGFLDPVSMLVKFNEHGDKVVSIIDKRLKQFYPELKGADGSYDLEEGSRTLIKVFADVYNVAESGQTSVTKPEEVAILVGNAANIARKIAESGFVRHDLTSALIKDFISGVEVLVDEEKPWLSRARLRVDTFKKVETLKNVIFYAITMSPRMRVVAYRGEQIVREIFKALNHKAGSQLMPEDFISLYDGFKASWLKERVICDFIAGMTDRYAVQFHGRLYSSDPESFYSPL